MVVVIEPPKYLGKCYLINCSTSCSSICNSHPKAAPMSQQTKQKWSRKKSTTQQNEAEMIVETLTVKGATWQRTRERVHV